MKANQYSLNFKIICLFSIYISLEHMEIPKLINIIVLLVNLTTFFLFFILLILLMFCNKTIQSVHLDISKIILFKIFLHAETLKKVKKYELFITQNKHNII